MSVNSPKIKDHVGMHPEMRDSMVMAKQNDNATANATDLATAIALANALKTDFNTLLAKLRAAGYLDS